MLTTLQGYSVLKSTKIQSNNGFQLFRYFLAIGDDKDKPYRVVRESFNNISYCTTELVLCDTNSLDSANAVYEKQL
jgi:hypothetical protein